MNDNERIPIDYVDAGPIDANTYIIGLKTESPYARKSKPADIGHLVGDALFLNKELKGVAGGIAELDASGKVPSSQLPSYVDDVIEGYLYNNKFYKESTHVTEIVPESGKIYIDITDDKNLSYRWGGTAYSEIGSSLALGETSATAYRGDRGKTAYDHSQLTSGNPHNVTAQDLNLSTVATTGSYNDLLNKPTIPAAQVNADWNAVSGVAQILNKPTIPTVPTRLSAFTDDLGSSPTHTHSQYLTSHQDISGKADKATTLAGYGITDAKILNGTITLGVNTIKPVTDISGKADKATTLAGYGITDAKIVNGTITLGSNTITPITDVSDRVPTSRTVNGKALSSNISLTAADVGAATSDHTHTTSIAADSGTSALDLSANTKYKLTAGGSTFIFKTPVDTNTWRPQPDWNATTGDAVIKNKPSSLPASDVYAWAKASTKPSYTASEVGAVPTTRTVNGKALSADISLTASDVDAAASAHTHNYAGSDSAGGPANEFIAEAGTSNVDRYVYFAYGTEDYTKSNASKGRATFDAGFKYNPSTHNLSVTKINGVAVGNDPKFTDTVYTHPSGFGAKTTSAVYKFTVNDNGHVTAGDTVTSMPASDVYAWAKAATKPSYTHNEIGAGDLTIGDGANRLYFRTDASWRAGVYYHTNSNESLVFGNKNSNTSWIFAVTDPNSRADWTTLTPSLQIKNQRVAINKLIANGTQGAYNLDVNGSTNSTTYYIGGSSAYISYDSESGAICFNS